MIEFVVDALVVFEEDTVDDDRTFATGAGKTSDGLIPPINEDEGILDDAIEDDTCVVFPEEADKEDEDEDDRLGPWIPC